MDRCESHGRKLGRLIDALLDVSRISARKLALDEEPVDVGQLVREVAARQSEETTRAGCELELSVVPGLVLRCDRMRIEQDGHGFSFA